MSKRKAPAPKAEEEIPPALKVFSIARDLDGGNPYHLDGDMEMYSEEKIQQRESLAQDPDIVKQLDAIVGLYELQDGKIIQKEYKRMQRKMALALRPDIDEQELEFVVDQDWELDQQEGSISPDQMRQKIFELVDVWTLGVDKAEYISFIRLLGKKLGRKKAEKKEASRLD